MAVLTMGLLGACRPEPTPVPPTPVATVTPTPAASATPSARPWTPGQLEIHVLAVDHGDAQLIISPSGRTLLIDGARVEFAPHVAAYLCDVIGELAVDYLLVSHYHIDHIQSIAPLLVEHGLSVREAVLDRGGGRQEYDSEHYRAYHDALTAPARDLNRVQLRPGDEIDMGPGVTLQVLAAGDPETDTNLDIPVIDENDNSIALWLTYGRFDYWTAGDLTGVNSIRFADIETAVIPLLPREADVYRVNHHAINYNSNPAFLAALNPTVSIASTYHSVVSWDTVLRLEEIGDLYITGRVPAHEAAGDIVVASLDGDSYTVQDRLYASR